MNADPGSLDRLHDVIAPPPVPWWPPAPGWYFLLTFVAALVVVLLIKALIRWQHNRYRREALAEWRAIEPKLAATDTRAAGLVDLAVLLKRTALSAFPRQDVANLTGDAWQSFLARTASVTPAVDALERAAYETGLVDEPQARSAAAFVRLWIVRHRGEH